MPEELRRKPKTTDDNEKKRLRSLAAEWRAKNCWSQINFDTLPERPYAATFGLEAAQVVLGHSMADVTQIYAERDLSQAERIMKEVG